MICRTSGDVKGPLKPLFFILEPPNYTNWIKKIHKQLTNILLFENNPNIEKRTFVNKRMPNQFLNIWNME